MGKLLVILTLALTGSAVAGGVASSSEPDGATGVTVTFVDITATPASTRPAGTTIGFEANDGPAVVRVTEHRDRVAALPTGPVTVQLNGTTLTGPLDLRRPGGELAIPVDLLAGTNQLEIRVLGRPTSAVDVAVVQHLGPSVEVDTVWGGHVLVGDNVVVQPGAVLTVLPGTTVAFEHYRGYRRPDRRLGLTVLGGIVAEGAPSAPISFTSDADDPRNGDWSMVRLETPDGPTSFDFVVFEFAQQGLNVWQGEDVSIAHAVFRWNNWEGIYFESRSVARIEHCAIYENGYNGLAAEQYDTLELESCEVRRNGTNGVHVDASTLEIRRSLVHDNMASGLSVDDNGILTVLGVASRDNGGAGIAFGEGSNTVVVGNVEVSGNAEGGITGPVTEVPTSYTVPSAVSVGFAPDDSDALGYIPGDPDLDEYLYVYPDDETRTIVTKIGEGLGLTWSLAWDGDHLWTATVWGTIHELDPATGAVLSTLMAPGPQPWGMTYDGTHLWVVDFAERRISKLDPATGAELATFPTPDPVGGAKGITWDGTHLYVMGWTSPTIYRMTTDGEPAGTIELPEGGGGIAWDGSHFWVPGGPGILRYDTAGNLTGWIYAASEGTWDLTWDGTFLWATQRTNENWEDAKIFALDVHPQPVP
jgi:hypothetical protein